MKLAFSEGAALAVVFTWLAFLVFAPILVPSVLQ